MHHPFASCHCSALVASKPPTRPSHDPFDDQSPPCRYVEGEKLCEKAEVLRQSHLDPEQRDLEEFIRTGEVSQPGASPFSAAAGARPHESPPRPFVDELYDMMCPSPKARAPSASSARKGTRAEVQAFAPSPSGPSVSILGDEPFPCIAGLPWLSYKRLQLVAFASA